MVTVAVADNYFAPGNVLIRRGGTVVWNFVGTSAHDVTGAGFASGLLNEGSFSWTFTAPGTFDYRCTIHPQMIGRATVR